jgi:hypothetical protein
MFHNRVLRRIFGPKMDKVVGRWRRWHNEKLHKLHTSPNITRVIKSRRVRWNRQVAQTREKRNAYKIMFRKPEGKRPL